MLDELIDLIDKEKTKKIMNHTKIRKKLISVVKVHQDLLRLVCNLSAYFVLRKFTLKLFSFILFVEDCFRFNLLIIIGSTVSQIVCCLFALVISKWFIGAFLFFSLSFQIFVFCAFGTILSVKVKKFENPSL
jgi:hypothetical protein